MCQPHSLNNGTSLIHKNVLQESFCRAECGGFLNQCPPWRQRGSLPSGPTVALFPLVSAQPAFHLAIQGSPGIGFRKSWEVVWEVAHTGTHCACAWCVYMCSVQACRCGCVDMSGEWACTCRVHAHLCLYAGMGVCVHVLHACVYTCVSLDSSRGSRLSTFSPVVSIARTLMFTVHCCPHPGSVLGDLSSANLYGMTLSSLSVVGWDASAPQHAEKQFSESVPPSGFLLSSCLNLLLTQLLAPTLSQPASLSLAPHVNKKATNMSEASLTAYGNCVQWSLSHPQPCWLWLGLATCSGSRNNSKPDSKRERQKDLEACPLLLLRAFHPCHMNQSGLSHWRMSDHVGRGPN